MEKYKPQVKAPIGFYRLRKKDPEKFRAVCGGCGPGQWGDYFVPDTLWGLSIRLACQIHDYMYWAGKTPEAKWKADSTFLENMIVLCWNGSNRVTFTLRALRAIKYFVAVVNHGDNAFKGENHGMDRSAHG
jgi:hypothetical protein